MQTNTITSQTTGRGHERWNLKIIIQALPLSILSELRIYYKHLGPWPDGVVSYRGGRGGWRIQLRWRLYRTSVTGCIRASRGWHPPPPRAHTHIRTHARALDWTGKPYLHTTSHHTPILNSLLGGYEALYTFED